MKKEIQRQLVHLSGLAFIFLAQFTGRIAAGFCFFMIGFSFLVYSEYIKREQNRFLNILKKQGQKFREFILSFERENIERPFQGAFWFFFDTHDPVARYLRHPEPLWVWDLLEQHPCSGLLRQVPFGVAFQIVFKYVVAQDDRQSPALGKVLGKAQCLGYSARLVLDLVGEAAAKLAA